MPVRRIRPISVKEFYEAVIQTANSMELEAGVDGSYFACRVYRHRRFRGLRLPLLPYSLLIQYRINHDGCIGSFDAEGSIGKFKEYIDKLQQRLGYSQSNENTFPEAV